MLAICLFAASYAVVVLRPNAFVTRTRLLAASKVIDVLLPKGSIDATGRSSASYRLVVVLPSGFIIRTWRLAASYAVDVRLPRGSMTAIVRLASSNTVVLIFPKALVTRIGRLAASNVVVVRLANGSRNLPKNGPPFEDQSKPSRSFGGRVTDLTHQLAS